MHRTVLEPFVAWVDRDPDRVAVSFEGRSVTYAELDRRSDAVAVALADAGVRAGDLVGLCVDRSPALVTAIFGVLKAGAAYLPLDPSYPSDRLTRIARGAGPAAIVAERAHAHLLPDTARFVWIAPSGGPESTPDHARPLPRPTLDPTSLAYVLFTSGSTGEPKGVPIEHRQVRWFFDAAQERFQFGADEVWSQFHSCGFDISVLEIFGALSFGGRVAMASVATCRQPAAFFEFLHREHVTVVCQTPSAFWPLDEIDDGRSLALRWVVFVGEVLDVRRLHRWIARRGDERPALVNMYGITETTVNAMFHRVTSADVAGPIASPIGRPLTGVDLRVVAEDGSPTPLGALGELWVGGPGVARGYVGRPDLTAERFTTDARTGGRYYRSGDLVVQHPSGEFESRGRRDHQVKVRGFRVELGEIESALREHPAVRDAIVLPRGAAERLHLVAWIVPAGPQIPIADVERWLRGRLPDYMWPARCVPIAQIPLTANGKIDRAALPDLSAPDRGRPPSSPTARALGAIWCHLLDATEVSLDDDFFALGGNSILAARLVATVRSELGVDLPLRRVFKTPTLGALANAVADAVASGSTTTSSAAHPTSTHARGVVALNERVEGVPLFLPFGLGGAHSGHELVDAIDHPMFGLVPPAGVDGGDMAALADALADVILAARPSGPFGLAGYSFAGMLAYELAVVLGERGRAPACLVVIDAGPRVRWSLPWAIRQLRLGVANVPRWMLDTAAHEGPREIARLVARKARAFASMAAARLGLTSRRVEALRFDTMYGGVGVAQSHRHEIERHLRAVIQQRRRVYRGPLTLIRAGIRPLLHSFEPDLGWHTWTTGPVEIVGIDANHHTIMTPPHVRAVGLAIAERLTRAGRAVDYADRNGSGSSGAATASPSPRS